MDILSFHSEKQAVVIDFGQTRTKIGFTNEATPRHILKTTELARFDDDGIPIIHSFNEWVRRLELFLRKAFYHYLQTSVKERKVVLVDDPLLPTNFRRAVAHVLFSQFQTPSIIYAPSLLVPLYTTGLNTGLVVDIGYSDSRAMATYSGVKIIQSLSHSKRGSLLIDRRIERALTFHASPSSKIQAVVPPQQLPSLQESHIEDIKVRACYVRADIDGAPLISSVSPAYINNGVAFNVPASLRWGASEALFVSDGQATTDLELKDIETANQFSAWWDGDSEWSERQLHAANSAVSVGSVGLIDNECDSLPNLIASAILKCPPECRKFVCQNILIIGGVGEMIGLDRRLAIELKLLFQKMKPLEGLADSLAFARSPFPPSLTAWTGAAIFGALENGSGGGTGGSAINKVNNTLLTQQNLNTLHQNIVTNSFHSSQWLRNECPPDFFDPFASIGLMPPLLTSTRLKSLNLRSSSFTQQQSQNEDLFTDNTDAVSIAPSHRPGASSSLTSNPLLQNTSPGMQASKRIPPTNPLGPFSDRTASSFIGTAPCIAPLGLIYPSGIQGGSLGISRTAGAFAAGGSRKSLGVGSAMGTGSVLSASQFIQQLRGDASSSRFQSSSVLSARRK